LAISVVNIWAKSSTSCRFTPLDRTLKGSTARRGRSADFRTAAFAMRLAMPGIMPITSYTCW
jgi:hypothetical protein